MHRTPLPLVLFLAYSWLRQAVAAQLRQPQLELDLQQLGRQLKQHRQQEERLQLLQLQQQAPQYQRPQQFLPWEAGQQVLQWEARQPVLQREAPQQVPQWEAPQWQYPQWDAPPQPQPQPWLAAQDTARQPHSPLLQRLPVGVWQGNLVSQNTMPYGVNDLYLQNGAAPHMSAPPGYQVRPQQMQQTPMMPAAPQPIQPAQRNVPAIVDKVEGMLQKLSPGSPQVFGLPVSMLRIATLWTSGFVCVAILLALRCGLRENGAADKKDSDAAQLSTAVDNPAATARRGRKRQQSQDSEKPVRAPRGILGTLMLLPDLARKVRHLTENMDGIAQQREQLAAERKERKAAQKRQLQVTGESSESEHYANEAEETWIRVRAPDASGEESESVGAVQEDAQSSASTSAPGSPRDSESRSDSELQRALARRRAKEKEMSAELDQAKDNALALEKKLAATAAASAEDSQLRDAKEQDLSDFVDEDEEH